MEIFLSWSEAYSHSLANAFRNWIPYTLQNIEPFMSEADIRLGSLWNESINNHLKSSPIGILFVTPENINSPWLNFEAGALSNSLDADTKVIPITFAANDSEVLLSTTPLKQFQSIITPDENGFKQLVTFLNSELDPSMALSSDVLDKTFDRWWPDLKTELDLIDREYQNQKETDTKKKPANTSIDSELLANISRNVDNLVRISKNELIPSNFRKQNSNAYLDLRITYYRLYRFIRQTDPKTIDKSQLDEIYRLVSKLQSPVDNIVGKNIVYHSAANHPI